ncbi:MAG: MFS transporter [Anaerolineales bacterium]|nr:MFS transporter [Anaerolineales bacterium]
MKRDFRWHDYITISINWFALTVRSQGLVLIVPLLVQQFVGEEQKGTYFGIIRLWALMVALLVQAFMGLLSDRSTSRWGRRRPFIFIGALSEAIIIVLIGFTVGMEGMSGYWLLFTLYILAMVASNTSHAATQGFIPDLVPDERKGIFSGIKAFLELPAPLLFISFVIGKMVGREQFWAAFITLAVVVVVSALITMFVREEPQEEAEPINWQPFLRLLVMTGVFTVVILGSGQIVKWAFQAVVGMAEPGRSILVAGIGVAGMGVAILLGVLVSIRVGIGKDFGENRSFAWWVVSRLAFLVGANNLASFMVYYFQEKFPEIQGGEASDLVAQVLVFVGIAILLAALPGGLLSDRVGKKALIATSGVLAALGTLVVVLSSGMTMIYVGGTVIGLAIGLFYASNWALGTTIVPKQEAAGYLGLSNLAGAGAGAIGAYIGGPIGDGASFTLLMGIFGILFFLSMFALLGIKEKKTA